MILRYPLGLLALIGIPIVILIYIIKSKYTEQTISSTYLWRLSEKFLKNKRPKPKLSGLISLILEIIAIASIALIISQPVISIKNAAKEYLFVLDTSGSMNASYDGMTRLEHGKKKIAEIINNSYDGSSYTIIEAKDKPEVLFERLKDKEKSIKLLNAINETNLEGKCVDSLGYAQYYYSQNSNFEGYLVTDKSYNTENIELINVSNNEENYALSEVELSYALEGASNLVAKGKAISYRGAKELTIALYLDGVEKARATVNSKNGEAVPFVLNTGSTEYKSIEVKILNEDALLEDNEIIFYNIEKAHAYDVLLVSDKPGYLKNILLSCDNLTTTVMSIDDYRAINEVSGYALYIYDSYSPSSLPKDGTIWLFNAEENIVGSGFTVQESNAEGPIVLELQNKNSHSLVQKLTKGLIGTDVYVNKYNKYGLTNKFNVLYDYEGLPMIFTGQANSGNREVVFAFDLHDSNFALQRDYITLCKNIIDYSFPIILEEASYVCGDIVSINVIPGCDSIRVIAPSGRASYIDATGLISDYKLTEVGSYTIIMRFGDNEKVFNIYSRLPQNESFDVIPEAYKIEANGDGKMLDGIYDKLLALFIILAIAYVADWMVYCYEQYQLR